MSLDQLTLSFEQSYVKFIYLVDIQIKKSIVWENWILTSDRFRLPYFWKQYLCVKKDVENYKPHFVRNSGQEVFFQ